MARGRAAGHGNADGAVERDDRVVRDRRELLVEL